VSRRAALHVGSILLEFGGRRAEIESEGHVAYPVRVKAVSTNPHILLTWVSAESYARVGARSASTFRRWSGPMPSRPAVRRLDCRADWLSPRRLCAASAIAGRSHGKSSPSKAEASWVFALVSEAAGPCLRIPQPHLLQFWPVWQQPLPRLSRGSNVYICGPSRNNRAGCAPAGDRSEQSLKGVYRS
jgi:hypothetical protein